MENLQPELATAQKTSRPRGIKTKDVKALHRAGMSKRDIANKFAITEASVYYHLSKKRAPKSTEPEVKSARVTSAEFAFSVNLFGVDIKLQQKPSSIIQSDNSIVIK